MSCLHDKLQYIVIFYVCFSFTSSYHGVTHETKRKKILSFLSPPSSLDEDAGFSPWSLWSPCTKTCTSALTPAMKSRHRQCIKPPCSGSSHQEKACNLPQCPGTATHNVSLCCCQCLWLLLLVLLRQNFHKPKLFCIVNMLYVDAFLVLYATLIGNLGLNLSIKNNWWLSGTSIIYDK